MTPAEAYSRGFDSGNYGNAYESEDWESWSEHHERIPGLHGLASEYYEAGLLLGFFSSYELHEIGDSDTRDRVAELREKHGEES